MLRHGKYKGHAWEHVKQNDRSYCAWLVEAKQSLPRDLRKLAENIEDEHGGVLQIGAHKHSFFDEVCDKHKDYAEWAITLAHPGEGMNKFAQFAKKRLAAQEETADEERKKRRRQGSDAESNESNEKKCVVCFNRAVQCAFVPCGHAIACIRCSALVEADGCPVCRSQIAMVLKIYT